MKLKAPALIVWMLTVVTFLSVDVTAASSKNSSVSIKLTEAKCGQSKSGRTVLLLNSFGIERNITIERRFIKNGWPGFPKIKQQSYVLPANGERKIGCTVHNIFPYPLVEFKVVSPQ